MNLFWIRKAGWSGTFPSHISSLLQEDYSVTNKAMCYSVFLYRNIFHYKPARQYLNLPAPQIRLDTLGQRCFLKNGTISQARTLSWIKPQRAIDSHIWTPYCPFSPPLSGGHSVTFCWFPPMPHAPAHSARPTGSWRSQADRYHDLQQHNLAVHAVWASQGPLPRIVQRIWPRFSSSLCDAAKCKNWGKVPASTAWCPIGGHIYGLKCTYSNSVSYQKQLELIYFALFCHWRAFISLTKLP